MADFAKVIELDPKHATAHYNLGLGAQQGGDVDRALTEYTKPGGLHPPAPRPWSRETRAVRPPPNGSGNSDGSSWTGLFPRDRHRRTGRLRLIGVRCGAY